MAAGLVVGKATDSRSVAFAKLQLPTAIERVPVHTTSGTRSRHEIQNADPGHSGTDVFQFANRPPGLFSHSQM